MASKKARSQRYIVSTRRELDEDDEDGSGAMNALVDIATGLPAACKLARERAYSFQTRAIVKNAKTGREIGGFRFALNKMDVIGRGRCRTR